MNESERRVYLRGLLDVIKRSSNEPLKISGSGRGLPDLSFREPVSGKKKRSSNGRLAAFLFAFNVFDVFATLRLYSLGDGWFKELNPLMRFFLEWDPLVFGVVKVGLALAVCSALALWPDRGCARRVLVGTAACFGVLTLLQLAFVLSTL